MEIDIEVTGSIEEINPPEVIPPVGRGFLVKIGFFLNDTLKVMGEDDDEVMKAQRCYEQKIVTRYSTQLRDASYVQQLVYNTLHDDMDMDPEAAEKAKAKVARTIMSKMEVASNNNSSLWTVFLEIRVECTIEISDEEAGEPSGEHGCNRLLERLNNDDCSICREDFDSTDHIVVTTCHHTYHSSCLCRWFARGTHTSRGSYTCPNCRSDLAPVAGLPIKF
ncbi:E3 ubiquitin ligase BIG BROTHER-related-like [Nymphaea colorata]|uniref:E3 ubiquitin ligase BIG BROTHER-related-like n=1 Tax=Nymphaea colorata TaxID=210225 RepID=UPI00129D5F46|nr:E3 ubiquitin ligase BIG BROTHER-related-like [Nymphaea colorata]